MEHALEAMTAAPKVWAQEHKHVTADLVTGSTTVSPMMQMDR
jgi:hypothetical protein